MRRLRRARNRFKSDPDHLAAAGRLLRVNIMPGLVGAGLIAVMILTLILSLARVSLLGPDVRAGGLETSFSISTATATQGDQGAPIPVTQSGRIGARSREVTP